MTPSQCGQADSALYWLLCRHAGCWDKGIAHSFETHHCQPHWQLTKSHRRRFFSSDLHTAHALIHMTLLPPSGRLSAARAHVIFSYCTWTATLEMRKLAGDGVSGAAAATRFVSLGAVPSVLMAHHSARICIASHFSNIASAIIQH